MSSQFSGGPRSTLVEIQTLMGPRGGSVADGIRLAVINTVAIILGAILIAIANLVLGWLGFPRAVGVFTLLVMLSGVGLLYWYRYADRHGRVARAQGKTVSPDVMGGIGGLPFLGLGLLVAAAAIMSLFFSVLRFSIGGAGDALGRLVIAAILLGLALANVIMARAASD